MDGDENSLKIITLKNFDKIKNSNLLTHIMLFLNLSNIKTLIFVNKRLRHHLLKNDSKELHDLVTTHMV
jgi:hypothetical protein